MQNLLPEEGVESLIGAYALDRAMLVDLGRSQALGGGVLKFSVPWRFVLLEDFRVFKDAELLPDPDGDFCSGLDHTYWKVHGRCNTPGDLESMLVTLAIW